MLREGNVTVVEGNFTGEASALDENHTVIETNETIAGQGTEVSEATGGQVTGEGHTESERTVEFESLQKNISASTDLNATYAELEAETASNSSLALEHSTESGIAANSDAAAESGALTGNEEVAVSDVGGNATISISAADNSSASHDTNVAESNSEDATPSVVVGSESVSKDTSSTASDVSSSQDTQKNEHVAAGVKQQSTAEQIALSDISTSTVHSATESDSSSSSSDSASETSTSPESGSATGSEKNAAVIGVSMVQDAEQPSSVDKSRGLPP